MWSRKALIKFHDHALEDSLHLRNRDRRRSQAKQRRSKDFAQGLLRLCK